MKCENGKNSASATESVRHLAKPILSLEARLYALWELCRRAGVTRQQFHSWKIEHRSDRLVVWINNDPPRRVEFPIAAPDLSDSAAPNHFEIARASWMFRPPAATETTIPDFVVPFAARFKDGQPLFRVNDPTSVVCSLDLLRSLVLTLSRYEETASELRDAHGRFPASASISAQHGFLERPIVDEYGLGFEQALSYLMPGWSQPDRELRVKLSHDIDDVGVPFRIRPVVGHTLVRRKPAATLRDFATLVVEAEPTYLACVRKLCRLSLENNLDSALYWKSSPYSDYDSGYSLFDRKVQAVIRWARDQGIEMGAHPGYYTYHSPVELQQQLASIQSGIGSQVMGGRQHYLRWSGQTWEDWEACGIAYDSSVGYADRIGFRAGTCVPYRPWLLGEGRRANLLEIPLLVMDVTVAGSWARPEEQLDRIVAIVRKCRCVGGVFTMLWHNNSLIAPCYGDTYIRLIHNLAGSKRFAWEDEICSPRAATPRGRIDVRKPLCAA